MKYNTNSGVSLDTVTGELGKKIYERFLFLRTVDNYEWMDGLGEGGIKCMLMLVQEANKDGFLEFTPRVRRRLMNKLEVKERMFYNILRKIKEKGLVKEVEKNYYLIAPWTAYKFHSKNMSDKIYEYLEA